MQATDATKGWIGLSQKYWFTGLIPDQQAPQTFRFAYTASPDPESKDPVIEKARRPEKFQVDVTTAPQAVAPGASASTMVHIYAGAKEAKTLQHYADTLPGTRLDLVIDWGLYWFLTRPFFFILDFFGHVFGNFGLAIIALTIIVRLAVFPARQHLVPLLRQDEEDRAGDEGYSATQFAGDKEKYAGGAGRAVRKGKSQPDGRLPAAHPADPDLLRAL